MSIKASFVMIFIARYVFETASDGFFMSKPKLYYKSEGMGKLNRSTTCEEKSYCIDAHDCSTHVCVVSCSRPLPRISLSALMIFLNH